MPQGGEKVSSVKKVIKCYVTFNILNHIFVFWPAFSKEKDIFWRIKNVTSHDGGGITYFLNGPLWDWLLGVNFIKILRTNFSYQCCFGSFFYVHVTREKLPKQHSYKKFVGEMLMKLLTRMDFWLILWTDDKLSCSILVLPKFSFEGPML
jgi:hypothetical protein